MVKMVLEWPPMAKMVSKRCQKQLQDSPHHKFWSKFVVYSHAGVLAPQISMKICGVSRYGGQNGVKMDKMVPKMVLRGAGHSLGTARS